MTSVPLRMRVRPWVAPIFCVAGLGAAAILNAQSEADPRIGVWEEQQTSTHFQSIQRVIESAPGGMTRMIINAKLDAQNRQHVDYRCDGRRYPILAANDQPVGMVYSCRLRGERGVESLLKPDGAASGIGTTVHEVVSKDGRSLTMNIAARSATGLESSQRTFARQKP